VCLGVIHGDFNHQNVLIRRSDSPLSESTGSDVVSVVGAIDFGDSEYAPYVYELSIAIMYCMLHSRSPLDVGGHLLAGYLSRRPRALSALERSAVWPCVAARFAQSLTLGVYTHSLDPANDYVLKTSRRGWSLLKELWEDTSAEQFNAKIDTVLASYGLFTS